MFCCDDLTFNLNILYCSVLSVCSDEVEPWLIAVVLLVSFLVVIVAVDLIFLAVWFGYRGCRIIFPDADLPEDLKKVMKE